MLQNLSNSRKSFSASSCLCKHFPCKNSSKCLMTWQSVRGQVHMADEAKFYSPIIQLLKHWLHDMWLGTAGQNWTLSIDQCWLQALQFSVHLIDLLSLLLRSNGFSRIQKAGVDLTVGIRPPNSDHDLFLVQVWFWEVLWSFFSV